LKLNILKLSDKLKLKENQIITLQDRLDKAEHLVSKPPEIKHEVEYKYYSRCAKCDIDSIRDELDYAEHIATFFIIYAIIVAIISVIKNKPLRLDILGVFTYIWHCLKNFTLFTYHIALKISNIAYKIANTSLASTIHWVILILFILVISALILCFLYFTVLGISTLFEAKWDTLQTQITIIIASIIIYLSDLLNPKIYANLNLVLIFLLAIILSTIVRIIIAVKE
jgi:hypothetical protein